jgi:hypothetical protein
MAHRAMDEFASVPVSEGRAREAADLIALETDDFTADMHLDIPQRRDAVDEVLRHRLDQRPSHDKVDAFYRGGEENDRLPRRIASTDKHDLLSFTEARFDRGSPI